MNAVVRLWNGQRGRPFRSIFHRLFKPIDKVKNRYDYII